MDKLKKMASALISILDEPNDIFCKTEKINDIKLDTGMELSDSFGDYYYKNINGKKEKGVVYTPKKLTRYVIESTIEPEDIINNPYLKILDPSCGTGNFIKECYFYLKNIYLENLQEVNMKINEDLKIQDIDKHIIDNNLFGFDIDPLALKFLQVDLWMESKHIKEENFICKDFLLKDTKKEFDIIIGNPPYIGHKTVDNDYVKFIKSGYTDVYKDKSDISYCFFKKAFYCLKNNGKLSFITSRYILETKSGDGIRNFIAKNYYIKRIFDFYGLRPFKGAGIDPVILFLEKDKEHPCTTEVIKPTIKKLNERNKTFIDNINEEDEFKKFSTAIETSKSGIWILIDEKEKRIIEKIEKKSELYIGDIADIYQGIITGCDKAFIVDEKTIESYGIEKELIKPWIKGSFIKKNEVDRKELFIIYSDNIDNEENYPKAISHIKDFKDKLQGRRECKKGIRKWYELQWGRNQKIFEEEKIIFPYKSSSNRFAIDIGSYFSADIYALKAKNQYISYTYIQSVLNSSIYEFYFKCFLKKLGRDLYEYYPNKILNLKIYLGDEAKVDDKILKEKMGITDKEFALIKEYSK